MWGDVMTEGIMIALITGGLAVFSNMIIVVFNNSKTLYRIEQLEKKQDKHNQLIERVYECENKLDVHEEKIKDVNYRINDLKKSC